MSNLAAIMLSNLLKIGGKVRHCSIARANFPLSRWSWELPTRHQAAKEEGPRGRCLLKKASRDRHEIGRWLPLHPTFCPWLLESWAINRGSRPSCHLRRHFTVLFKTCLVVAQAIMLPRDVAELQKEDRVMACSLSIMKNLQVSSLPQFGFSFTKTCKNWTLILSCRISRDR